MLWIIWWTGACLACFRIRLRCFTSRPCLVCVYIHIYSEENEYVVFSSIYLSIWHITHMQRSLHGSCPVIRGEKWVATKWIRDQEQIWPTRIRFFLKKEINNNSLVWKYFRQILGTSTCNLAAKAFYYWNLELTPNLKINLMATESNPFKATTESS